LRVEERRAKDKAETMTTMTAPIPDHVDIAIAGGGIAGLTLAVALKHGLDDAVEIAVLDPAGFSPRAGDLRASAIAAGTRRMFETLGIWNSIAEEAQPINDMVVTDTTLSEPIRQPLLTFDGTLATGEVFAHMVANVPLLSAVIGEARRLGVHLVTASVDGFAIEPDQVMLNGRDVPKAAGLLIAADGARSRLRELAAIPFYGWAYGQSALVATIDHSEPHEGRAVEHFLPSGPFAILPLKGNRSSIVWTEREADARRMLATDPFFLLEELEKRFGLQLGDLSFATPLKAYPLSLGIARRFVTDRFALLGDAAHAIHPIAGQGLNLGLQDAAALAERLTDALRLGLDVGDPAALAAYERDRRFATASMAVTTDLLNRLFSNDVGFVRAIRSLGLGIVDRTPPLKRFFMGQASGTAGRQPRLMAGEAL
jgi:2-octaprenyl-6-methoxyphenol hydroxylase